WRLRTVLPPPPPSRRDKPVRPSRWYPARRSWSSMRMTRRRRPSPVPSQPQSQQRKRLLASTQKRFRPPPPLHPPRWQALRTEILRFWNLCPRTGVYLFEGIAVSSEFGYRRYRVAVVAAPIS